MKYINKKVVAKLVEVSYNKGRLDEHKINKIIKILNRKDLREYLKALKRQESKNNVFIDHSFDLSDQDKQKLGNLFPDKTVIFRKDPGLVWGIRILEDDKVYNLNMKNVLEQMRIYLNKTI